MLVQGVQDENSNFKRHVYELVKAYSKYLYKLNTFMCLMLQNIKKY